MENESTKQVKSDRFVMIFRLAIIVALIGLTYLTVVASIQFGLIGIFEQVFKSSAAIQVFVDLVIAIGLISVWMWFDSRKNKRMFIPWLILSLAIGSYGPLLYLLFREKDQF